MSYLRAAQASLGGGGAKSPPSKIYNTQPAMVELGTVTPDQKKFQKTYKSRDTPLRFFCHQHFFIGNQQLLLYQETRIKIAF